MSKRVKHPNGCNRAAREALLEAMSTRSSMSAVEIGKVIGKNQTSATQMLNALESDGCVRRGAGKRAPNGSYPPAWFATGEALPETLQPTSRSQPREPFDFAALMRAWPANGEPHTRSPVGARRVPCA